MFDDYWDWEKAERPVNLTAQLRVEPHADSPSFAPVLSIQVLELGVHYATVRYTYRMPNGDTCVGTTQLHVGNTTHLYSR